MSDNGNGNGNHDPLTPAGNGDGRGPNGRFATGNSAGKGNPLNRKAQELRNALLAAVDEDDIRGALKVLKDIIADTSARPGERLAAISELFDRVLGKPLPGDIQAEIDGLRAQVEEILTERAQRS